MDVRSKRVGGGRSSTGSISSSSVHNTIMTHEKSSTHYQEHRAGKNPNGTSKEQIEHTLIMVNKWAKSKEDQNIQ